MKLDIESSGTTAMGQRSIGDTIQDTNESTLPLSLFVQQALEQVSDYQVRALQGREWHLYVILKIQNSK